MKTFPLLQRLRAALPLLLALACAPAALANVRLPSIFSDHMVLQRGVPLPVWGWAEPSEEVTVTIAGQTQTTKADAAGKWKVKLAPLQSAEPLTFTVKGRNTLTVTDVLVGEVWLCSGQSNMAMTVERSQDFDQEKAAAKFPAIRMFRQADGAATTPQEQGQGAWFVCSPESVGGFSATAYFFGRDVHQKIKAPVGLINSSVGGTAIEAWTSIDVQKNRAELKPIFDRWAKLQADWSPEKAQEAFVKQVAGFKDATAKARAEGKPAPRPPRKPTEPIRDSNHPANLFNGKIMPLIPYAIRGAIWYQGESNAGKGNADLYRLQLELLTADWRSRWAQGDFPFAWVQLPNFRKPQTEPVEDSGWSTVREAMLQALKIPNTGMAIAIDVGEANDIHPKNKQAVGQRLANWALAKVYEQKDVAASGPLPAGSEIEGNEINLSFQHTHGGLVAKGGELKGFAIAGADKKWLAAKARIAGDKVILSHPDVKTPVAARYAWAENPACNLFNGAGLPASPFRTDDWK